jgi:hypothetical protein
MLLQYGASAIQIAEGLGVLHCVMNHVVSSLRLGLQLLHGAMSVITDTIQVPLTRVPGMLLSNNRCFG